MFVESFRLALVALVLSAVSVGAQQGATPAAGRTGQGAQGNGDNGKKLFVKYSCSACHGLEGQGAPTTGPRLGPNPLPYAGFARVVRRPPNQMPPYTEMVLPEQELRDIYTFLEARPKPAAASVLPN